MCVVGTAGCRRGSIEIHVALIGPAVPRLAWAIASVAAAMVRAEGRHGLVFIQGA